MIHSINNMVSGSGLPLVFQHGLTANLKQVEALLLKLPGVQLLSIDCPGHGSSKLPQDYQPSFNSYANEVINFIDDLGIEQAVFGGISMGSGIAVNIALRYPERVKGLLLVRPAWLDRANPENLQVLLPAADLMNEPGGKARFCENQQFKQIIPPGAAQSILGIFSEDQQRELAGVIEAMVGDQPFKNLESLKQIRKATLVIGNDHDPLHPYQMAKKIHQTIPGSVLRKVTSRYIDHDLHSSQVLSIIQKFIQENYLN